MPRCPDCYTDQAIKNGSIHTGKQKYACKACGRHFVADPEFRIIKIVRRCRTRCCLTCSCCRARCSARPCRQRAAGTRHMVSSVPASSPVRARASYKAIRTP